MIEILAAWDSPIYENMCEKPTPLGVGWIAQNIKIMRI